MSLTTAAVVILSLWVVGIVVAGLVMTLRPGGVGVKFTPASTPGSGGVGTNTQEIPLGGVAQVLGNFRGTVVAVLLEPASRRLRGIQLGGGISEGETVPGDAILGADGNTVSLADGWQDHASDDAPANTAIFRDNMPVVDQDGKRLGRLRLVSYDPASLTATALVIDARSTGDRRLVPMEQVVEAGPDRVVTNIRPAELGRLQTFATDWDLRQEIFERLAGDPALAGLQRALQVDVRDQRVRLRGYVADRGKAEQVETVVRNVPGVVQVQSQLTTDDQLAQAVKAALARDPGTGSAPIDVSVRSGIVDITGEVPDRATVRRIDQVMQNVDGAQVVHNMVVVRPGSASAARR